MTNFSFFFIFFLKKCAGGSIVKSLTNSAIHLSQIDKTSQKDDKKDCKEKSKMKNTSKINIGHSSSKEREGSSTSQQETLKRHKTKKNDGNSERGRRSLSCDMSINPPNQCQVFLFFISL